MYASRHKNCPLCSFEMVEISDTFYDREHTDVLNYFIIEDIFTLYFIIALKITKLSVKY
jgi:hypothetical protein